MDCKAGMDSLIRILGKSIDDPFVESVLEPFELRRWESNGEDDDLDDDSESLLDTAQGLEVQFSKAGIIETVFLYSHGHQGFARFPRPLINGLTLQSTREEVQDAIGEPTHSGGPNEMSLLGRIGPWDRYDRPDGALHFQFRYDVDAIQLVTLMTLSTAPTVDLD